MSAIRHGVAIALLMIGMTPGFAQIDSRHPLVGEGILDSHPSESAAPSLGLTQAQKNAIAQAISKDKPSIAAPPKFVVSVGAPVPPSIELYMLPDAILGQIPAAKIVKYTIVGNQIVLVNPTTMRVVSVIKKQAG